MSIPSTVKPPPKSNSTVNSVAWAPFDYPVPIACLGSASPDNVDYIISQEDCTQPHMPTYTVISNASQPSTRNQLISRRSQSTHYSYSPDGEHPYYHARILSISNPDPPIQVSSAENKKNWWNQAM